MTPAQTFPLFFTNRTPEFIGFVNDTSKLPLFLHSFSQLAALVCLCGSLARLPLSRDECVLEFGATNRNGWLRRGCVRHIYHFVKNGARVFARAVCGLPVVACVLEKKKKNSVDNEGGWRRRETRVAMRWTKSGEWVRPALKVSVAFVFVFLFFDCLLFVSCKYSVIRC